MHAKKIARVRRSKRARQKVLELRAVRLSVHRTPRHTYAQLVDPRLGKVLAAASTLEADLRSGPTGNIEAARKVGELIAQRGKSAGIQKVAFDRSGFSYHGRVKALADAAREGGLEF